MFCVLRALKRTQNTKHVLLDMLRLPATCPGILLRGAKSRNYGCIMRQSRLRLFERQTRQAMEHIFEVAAGITPLDAVAVEQAGARQVQLTKPPGSLGRLEEIA